MTISVTNNWQLHIPLSARKIIGLERPGRVLVEATPGKLTIKPKQSKILLLAGSLHKLYKNKPVDIDNIREAIDYSGI